MTDSGQKGVLFLCFGNPARLDDGLGIRFGESLAKTAPENSTIEVDYQLTLEDAAKNAVHETVIFVDACIEGPEPFSFEAIEASDEQHFSTHILRPENLLYLAKEIFGSQPEAYTLAIRGYRFGDFGEHLTTRAGENLDRAIAFGRQLLQPSPVGFERRARQAARGGLDS